MSISQYHSTWAGAGRLTDIMIRICGKCSAGHSAWTWNSDCHCRWKFDSLAEITYWSVLVFNQIHIMMRNSLSNFRAPCPLGSAFWAWGAAQYTSNQPAQAINNKPFQCSNGCDSPHRRRSAARVEQEDFFKFYACSRWLISAHPSLAQRRRSAARVEQQDLFKFYACSRSLISAYFSLLISGGRRTSITDAPVTSGSIFFKKLWERYGSVGDRGY